MGFGCWAFGGLQGALFGGRRFGDAITALRDGGLANGIGTPSGEGLGTIAIQARPSSSLSRSQRPLKGINCGARASRAFGMERSWYFGDGNAETASIKAAAIVGERIVVTRSSCRE